MQVSETVALRGVDGEGEDGCARIRRGGYELDVFAEEGSAPSLRIVRLVYSVHEVFNATERYGVVEKGRLDLERVLQTFGSKVVLT